MIGVVNFVKVDKEGQVYIPTERIQLEIILAKTKDQVKVRYIFDDTSIAEILFTKDRDYILYREGVSLDRFVR